MATGAARDLTKETFWRRMSARQAGSKLSIRAWCRKHGVNEGTFHWWRRVLARRDAEGKPPVRGDTKTRSTAFVPVRITEDRSKPVDPRIEIVLTDGRCVRVHGSVDRQALADVLVVLEGDRC
jgi:transposase-like protein